MADRSVVADSAVAVFLCTDLEGHGLDLATLRRWAPHALSASPVAVLPDLCRLEDSVTRTLRAAEASRLVLGICDRPSSLGRFHARLRRAGLDPSAVEAVNLGGLAARAHPRPVATEKAKLLLAGAAARVRAFRGSRPDQWKPVLPAAVTRRAMMTWSVFEYQPVPSVDGQRCRVADGCSLCVDACPHHALDAAGDGIRLERAACTGCGVCVTACPHDAVEMPGADPSQLSAQVREVLRAPASLEPRGILFACAASMEALEGLATHHRSFPPHWLPVEVPCLGMVPAVWMLAPLGLGASAVAVLPCGDRCRSARQEVVGGRVAYCQEVLRRLGLDETRITLLPPAGEMLADALQRPLPSSGAGGMTVPDHPILAAPASGVLLGLAGGAAVGSVPPLAHPYSPWGLVEVTDRCTVCGACAAACPTDALVVHRTEEESRLTFAPDRCVACGRCVPACPEPEALRMRQVTDLRRLGGGQVDLKRAPHRRCVRCGAPIAPEAMLQRITALLGGEDGPGARVIGRLCVDCRAHQAGA
jgi:ferredoxin/coenzyme F420-reducing hydrogenase delta subunit